jgi:diguanylate cyclase (GGDEF)-like protein
VNPLHSLLQRQLRRSRRADGSIDVDNLVAMVSAAYEESDRDRKRTDRSISQMVEELEHRAEHDILTGLANRSLLANRIRARMSAAPGATPVAVLFIDLDRFKDVNDTMGHPAGDELLRAVAERLVDVVGDDGLVARLGGDEFAVAQWNNAGRDHAGQLAGAIAGRLSEPYALDGKRVSVGASVGIALAPDDGVAPDDLLRCADMALYRVKRTGKGRYVFFAPEMAVALQSRKSIEDGLRAAMDCDGFELHFQPIIEVGTMRRSSYESLLRWRCPTRGLVSPAEFIPIAESSGLIIPIGKWVIRQACAEAMRLPAEASISINLSPTQIESDDLVDTFEKALDSSGLPASRLELEITEHVLLRENSRTSETLQRLRDLGLRLSLDDFGAGHSSLSYLQKFHFDKIKIDRSFCSGVDSNPINAALVRAVAALGRDLGIEVVAEGVESAEESDTLISEGCGYLQGFYYGRPTAAVDIVADEALATARRALDLAKQAGFPAVLTRKAS